MKIGALAIMKKSHSAKFMTNILEGVRNGFALKQNVGPPPFNRAVKTTQRARLTGEIVFVQKKKKQRNVRIIRHLRRNRRRFDPILEEY